MASRPRGGPHNLGDPEDMSLRKVEKDVLIPKKMRELTRTEKCQMEVDQFNECAKINGLSSVLKCRPENALLKECLAKWYTDENFIEHCTQIYLKERSEYRRTGVSTNQGIRMGT
ncbi:unnamed protein product [Phyllotreta striolata]|uniref:COX assembly mitochondrial protein n=1 Tax=Phyllotreta striolata TaxID=444603 RepID=A0A9N9TR32_PHYSR|nr:unnamed protein product [Phyllotreta striolata]